MATNCYLGTCRSRSSEKRHARLLDYHVHDGCNAKAFVYLELNSDTNKFLINKGTRLLTKSSTFDSDDVAIITLGKLEESLISGTGVEPYETIHDIVLYSSHNEILFYTWGESQCCLPKGATSATIRNDDNKFDLPLFIWEEIIANPSNLDSINELINYLGDDFGIKWLATPDLKINTHSDNLIEIASNGNGHHLPHHLYLVLNDKKTLITVSNDKEANSKVCELYGKVNDASGKTIVYSLSLRVGAILIIEEICSPTTFKPENADPSHRQAVRLSKISPSTDPLFGISLLDIGWRREDALLFPVCLEVQEKKDDDHEEELEVEGQNKKITSLVRGNIVLVDHGYTMIAPIDSSLIQPPASETGGEINIVDPAGGDTNDNPIINATEFLGFAIPFRKGMNRFRPRLSKKPLTFGSLERLNNGRLNNILPAYALTSSNVRARLSIHRAV